MPCLLGRLLELLTIELMTILYFSLWVCFKKSKSEGIRKSFAKLRSLNGELLLLCFSYYLKVGLFHGLIIPTLGAFYRYMVGITIPTGWIGKHFSLYHVNLNQRILWRWYHRPTVTWSRVDWYKSSNYILLLGGAFDRDDVGMPILGMPILFRFILPLSFSISDYSDYLCQFHWIVSTTLSDSRLGQRLWRCGTWASFCPTWL